MRKLKNLKIIYTKVMKNTYNFFLFDSAIVISINAFDCAREKSRTSALLRVESGIRNFLTLVVYNVMIRCTNTKIAQGLQEAAVKK